MIFSLLISAVFVFMALYTLVFLGRTLFGWFLILAYGVAIYMVWRPDVSTQVAHLFGVGRGVDLILMVVSVFLLNAILLLVRHMNLAHYQLTKLARYTALRDALRPSVQRQAPPPPPPPPPTP